MSLSATSLSGTRAWLTGTLPDRPGVSTAPC